MNLLSVGNALIEPTVKQTHYADDGKIALQVTFKPHRKDCCYVSVFLGVMPKNEKNPGMFARQRLIDLGWSPPAEETDE